MARIPSTAIESQLKRKLESLYLVFGQETLLIEESVDAIRAAASDQGFNERIRLTVETGFDWSTLHEHSQSMSLFGGSRLIELRMPTGKPGDKGRDAILEYIESQSPDAVLVIVAGRIDKAGQRTKWFKQVESHGVAIETQTVRPDQLPGWVEQRLQRVQINYDRDAVLPLCRFIEGNLLAAAQEIEKLKLLLGENKLTASDLETMVADQARYNVYGFVDACLAGNAIRSLRMLRGLKGEATEPALVLWALARDTRTMTRIAGELQSGKTKAGVFKAHQIWSSRAGLVDRATQRLSLSHWHLVLQRVALADRVMKGRATGDIWHQFENIALAICGINALAPANQV
ncbi:MAG: DNA polymerase III subunit delta [Gammaproteobacteria bacterium]|nr:DNA polymerase III subunit delta [Gammaproteobacteria bacterium]